MMKKAKPLAQMLLIWRRPWTNGKKNRTRSPRQTTNLGQEIQKEMMMMTILMRIVKRMVMTKMKTLRLTQKS